MDKDTVWKRYLSDDRRYADILNGFLFGGRQIVSAEDIQDRDTQVRPPGTGGKRGTKIRDTIRKVKVCRNYAMAGLEAQEDIDYSMPLRDLCYGVGEYEAQAAGIRREVRSQGGKLESGEYLYRFRRDSRVHPVVTLVLYCGTKEWDGPRTLHGMTDFTGMPEELRAAVPDYKLNIIEVRKLEETGMFRTDVRQVLDFIRASGDREELKRLVENDPYYQEMEEDAFDVAICYAKAGELIKAKDYNRNGGKVDMCEAIQGLIEDGRKEGIEKGRKEGMEKGMEKGRKEGIRKGIRKGMKKGWKAGIKEGRESGRKEGIAISVKLLQENMGWTEEQARAALKHR